MKLPTDKIQNLKLLALLTFLCLVVIATADDIPVGAQQPGVDKGSDNQEGTGGKVRPVGETPAVLEHLDQADIESGQVSLRRLIAHGRLLFEARFNTLDGQGRPAATGNGTPTKRDPRNNPGFLRTSGVDANSCAGCHNQPSVGGAGDFVANVFVLAQVRDPVITSVDAEFSNERNTLGMHGAGAIEMLAREMTADLHAVRDAALREAAARVTSVTRQLLTKGVSFGQITARPDGAVDTSRVEGVDPDLVIKPFHQKGVVRSLREFSNNAYNHHHGMQSVERFSLARTGTDDFDEDSVPDELTVGDITAVSIFQAALGNPGQVIPSDRARRNAVESGEARFAETGCAVCHVPALKLNGPVFSEPNPYNLPGNLRPEETTTPVSFDLTRKGLGPSLERTPDGGAIVRAFTDLKRHVICDDEDPFFRNERVIQGGVPIDTFITRKLWDVGNTAPYGHRGDLTTITEAILHHAGEARASRMAFARLSREGQGDIIEFLKSLQVLPEGSPRVVTERELAERAKRMRVAAKGSQ